MFVSGAKLRASRFARAATAARRSGKGTPDRSAPLAQSWRLFAQCEPRITYCFLDFTLSRPR
jgi:hypothetical protein